MLTVPKQRAAVEDMGSHNGYTVTYRRANQTYEVTDPDGVTFTLDYGRICALASLAHALDDDATRRAFTE